jgi:hypothetical protein
MLSSKEMISGDVPERFNGTDCKSVSPSGFAGSNPAVAANFAAEAKASTSAPAFNHTQPKLRGSKQRKLYALGCVSQKGAQSWTNKKREKNAVSL